MRIVDAHVHVWDADSVPIPWFRDDLGLPRQAAAARLGRELTAARVSSAIAVQAADSVAEAEWLTATAASDPFLRRVVLQYTPPPERAAGAPAVAFSPAVVGVRAAVPQFAADLSDVDSLDALADHLGATARTLELLIRPDQLPAAAALSRRHPGTAIVVCHLGLGARTADAAWRSALAAAASAPGVSAKVSGLDLPTRGEDESRALLRLAVDLFGAERLSFGSDWPMSTRATTYAAVLGATHAALPPLSDVSARAFWSETADRLYPLPA
ncbi:amidohydrolase family protein [Microbacterium resistens]|uniref:Amidohydrolase family protein n=1 Tax=Microbacterium resistens TaxID=156977 RepID=A0ABY3RPV9_9MICO|nr:amidohydrolase family protein [Microbacterium resistens]UGS26057.1 amidohydrolase family protein [Microbacterium resistens]